MGSLFCISRLGNARIYSLLVTLCVGKTNTEQEVSALGFVAGIFSAMENSKEVPADSYLFVLATELGFTDLHQIQREGGLSTLFHARWKGAPDGISHTGGLQVFWALPFIKVVQIPRRRRSLKMAHSYALAGMRFSILAERIRRRYW